MSETELKVCDKPKYVSIIGTCNRDQDPRMTAQMFVSMFQVAVNFLRQFEKIILVSGGSSWSDHIALSLWLSRKETQLGIEDIHLHLPCEFDFGCRKFVDRGSDDWRTNPGRTLNQYHRTFSLVVFGNKEESLNQISTLQPEQISVHSGFHSRNTLVAKSNFLLAYTFEKQPTSGGTFDTWKKARKNGTICFPVCLA